MSRFRLLALLLTCLVLPLGIAACGGDDDDGGSDEEQIAEAIETAATSTDPEDCSRLQTEAFLEQSELTVGDESALESCEEDAEDDSDNPDSVEVDEITVDGDSASADAAFTGGPQDGSTYTVALVKEGDDWKLDQITDIPVFNSEAFRAGLEEQIAGAEGVPPEVVTCFTDVFAATSDEELQSLILSGSEDEFLALIGPCIPAGA